MNVIGVRFKMHLFIKTYDNKQHWRPKLKFEIMKWTITALSVIILMQLVYSQDHECSRHISLEKVSNPCKTKGTCRECIATDRCCSWCTIKDIEGERCDYLPEIQKKCNGSYMFPRGHLRKIQDQQLRDETPTEDAIQLKPQKVYVELKPNEPFSFSIQYKQASDYPVDLYFLMDLSNSMKDDKKKLAGLGDTLAKRMKQITSRFQLGFGSFVEKIALPFVNTHPTKLLSPCTGCAPPYTFLNNMPLNKNTTKFKEEVNRAETSGNYDAPEAGFDALMQAIVCKHEINWRENSRKLLVLATDAGYHYAGDGKLAGIVRPNDGKCHLNATGFYTEGTRQDYPSIAQIRKAILRHKVNVIFAVTSGQTSEYESLSRKLDGSTVGELNEDSANIVELIQDQYNKITSAVRLVHDAKRPIEVSFYSSCLGGAERKADECDGIGIGGSVEFRTEIELTHCPKDKTQWNQTFQIYPVGLNEAVTVDLRMICECDCEKPWNQEKASDYCSNGHGTYECGICSCNKDRLGKKCQCNATISDFTSDVEDKSACMKPNDTVECSGKGRCFCGRCECFPHENPEDKTTGQYCQCDNFSCDRHNGKPCGGPNQGTCECGECLCLSGWIGKGCECHNTNETCINPEDKKLCSGHGTCKCGECFCKETEEERYSGKFCEKCVVCPGSCEAYKACVQCKAFQSGPLTKEECQNCTGSYKIVKDIDLAKSSKECYFDDDDGCRFVFTYKIEADDSVAIVVKEDKECSKPVNALAISSGVAGGIVAIGIATLLIWKLLTSIHDSREYAKFLKEQKLSKWNNAQNPLYKNATTTFQNPSFGKDD